MGRGKPEYYEEVKILDELYVSGPCLPQPTSAKNFLLLNIPSYRTKFNQINNIIPSQSIQLNTAKNK